MRRVHPQPILFGDKFCVFLINERTVLPLVKVNVTVTLLLL